MVKLQLASCPICTQVQLAGPELILTEAQLAHACKVSFRSCFESCMPEAALVIVLMCSAVR